MKVPLLDLTVQYKNIRDEIDAAIAQVVTSQHFILGEEVERFEQEMAAYCGTKYAVGVASGTDALILALKALNIGPGDEVITTPYTFFATAESVSLVGATPVFVDIDLKTYCIDPTLIEKKITSRTKAIIPVHLYGQCADMDSIYTLAQRHHLYVIEDAAQAVGASFNGKRAGSMGDIGCLSFFPSKNLGGFGDGGMIVTNKKELADRMRLLRVHGSAQRYVHECIGYNSRLDALQAAVLRIKLKYLDRWLEQRREIAAYYTKNLHDILIACPQIHPRAVHTYHLYPVRVERNRETLIQFLNECGVEARAYYQIPLHLQECYRFLCYRNGDLPKSEQAALQVFSLPIFPELTITSLDYVIKQVKKFFMR